MSFVSLLFFADAAFAAAPSPRRCRSLSLSKQNKHLTFSFLGFQSAASPLSPLSL